MKPVHALLSLVLLLAVQPATADEPALRTTQIQNSEVSFPAKSLFGEWATKDIILTADGKAITLADGVLIEDDGPAAGYSYKPNEEKLTPGVLIRKELVVGDPRARKATLLVGPGGNDVTIRVNGKPVGATREYTVGGYWSAYAIPPEALRKGRNDFVLGGRGKVWIARADDFASGSRERPVHPNRSSRSTDDGRTWDHDRLGLKGDIDGEYCVRLFLDQARPAGSLVSPVFDIGNLAEEGIGQRVEKPGAVKVVAKTEGQGITIRVRSGPDAAPDAKSWTAWQPLDVSGESREPAGRFFQVAIEFTAPDPLHPPRLRELRLGAYCTLATSDWSTALKVGTFKNASIIRSSIPFAYEPFDHPRLKQLRERHRLDDVVKGAKDELELVDRLAKWASSRWERGHLKDGYPAWDAQEILKPHADGTPTGGFCQQYNLVFLQACESFGIPGRAVSIGPGDHHGKTRGGGGHEVVELYLNMFQKWVYIDGNTAWYAVDEATGTPLSLLDLRQRQQRVRVGQHAPATKMVHLNDGGLRWTSLKEWPPFQELRLIPRSNFLQEKMPVPLNQGMRGWFWTGHHVWTDDVSPASLLYGHRVCDRRNWEWTLNQVHLSLEASPKAGELIVHLDTNTPGFDAFLASRDRKAAEGVASRFAWKLHPGINRLEVRSRNSAGREGKASVVEIVSP